MVVIWRSLASKDRTISMNALQAFFTPLSVLLWKNILPTC
jgi:hypothetical protein